MIEDAIAVLESATTNIYAEHQQSADVWEALRTVRAAGAAAWQVDEFWLAAGRWWPYGGRTEGSRQTMFSAINGICRDLKIERTFRRHPDIETLPCSLNPPRPQ